MITIPPCWLNLEQEKKHSRACKPNKPMYHTLHSPRSRCRRSVIGPPRGCLRRKPDGRAAPRRTPETPAPVPPCRARPPLRCSRNSPTRTCTSGPHLQQAATGWKKIVPSDSKMRSQPTGDAGGEVCPARHLPDGLSLQLLHLFRLPVGGLISMAQLAHHFCSTLNILKSRGRKPLVNKDKSTQRTAYRSVLTAHV